MSLLERPVLAAPEAPAPAPGRRSRRWVPMTAAITGLTLLAGWLLLPWLVHFEQGVDAALPEPGSVAPGLEVVEYGRNGYEFLHYRHHETVTLAVPLANRSPVPLTVESAELVTGPYPLLVPAGAEPLPVTVAPYSTVEVGITLRFDNCRYYHERSATNHHSVAIAGTALGREFRTEITLARPVTVHGQVILDCPDRTLVRGDDQRDEPAPGH